jgi:3-methylcrotonyl-CoA carboxylase alpha subunit
VKAAKAVDYIGAGTIEFIADASDGLRADRIWFMEMNTRLQVEHPVTEAITGQDLVEWQLRVASGEPLPLRQEELRIDGWAMEARLYAENPATGFLPSTGPLARLRFPEGVRIDSGVEEGGEVTPFYDPMIAKLIVHAPTRRAAAAKLAAACRGVEVWPVRTNAAFLARAAADPDFVGGHIDTGFIERHADRLVPGGEPAEAVLQAAARALMPASSGDPWEALAGFRTNMPADLRIEVEIADVAHLVTLASGACIRAKAGVQLPATIWTPAFAGAQILFLDGEAWPFGQPVADHAGGGGVTGDGVILAPMPGRVIAVNVAEGDRVAKGQTLVVIEAMKMEQALVAQFDGIVGELKAAVGAQVSEGTMLARIDKEEA